MNFSVIIYILGYALKIEGILMMLPAIVGALYRESAYAPFLVCAAATFLVGFVLSFKRPKNQVFYAKEGFISVPLCWIVLSLFGCVPFILSGDIPNFVDAFFEIVSGFTTTGSSILKNVEVLSHATLFWRSFSHWIGGMGILVFILSVLPLTGGATMHLMRAESPGPQVGKFVPRVKDTSKILYLIYGGLTLAEMIILIIGKMPVFDAVTLSFGTAGTGGFGVRNDSLASYSAFCQYVVAVFMILFGVNFNVYFLAFRRHFKQALHLEEPHWYFGIVLTAVAILTLNTLNMFRTVEQAFRGALFQVASIITTTGYSTYDFNLAPQLTRHLLLFLMFIGACAGSTGGGIKVSRIVIMLKSVKNELSRIVHPNAVKKIQLDGKPVDHVTLRSVNIYMLSFLVVFCSSILLISLNGFNFETNVSAVVATINNIGPGLSKVGPAASFADFSAFSKLVFCFDMLAGRLEIIPILVLFSPATYRRS